MVLNSWLRMPLTRGPGEHACRDYPRRGLRAADAAPRKSPLEDCCLRVFCAGCADLPTIVEIAVNSVGAGYAN